MKAGLNSEIEGEATVVFIGNDSVTFKYTGMVWNEHGIVFRVKNDSTRKSMYYPYSSIAYILFVEENK
jgi:hypothetical protein